MFNVADHRFQEETTFKFSRIMMFSQLMSGCSQSDTKRFAKTANLFAAQPERTSIRQYFAGLLSVNPTHSSLNPGSKGLRSEESSHPLRP